MRKSAAALLLVLVFTVSQALSVTALPASRYLQPPVGSCSVCGAPLFERTGSWADDTRCYGCWAIDRDKWSVIQWTPPAPYCLHCGGSTLGNTSGYCDTCVMAACGSHTQTVSVKDKATGAPLAAAKVTGGGFQQAETDASGTVRFTDAHMHIDGDTTLLVARDGYRSEAKTVSLEELADGVAVELEPLPEVFGIPIDPVSFVGEAWGPVALNSSLEFERLPFPIKIENLLNNEVTVKRNPETGHYEGKLDLSGAAGLLFQGDLSLEGTVTADWDDKNARLELLSSSIDASITLSRDFSLRFIGVDASIKPQVRLTGYYDDGGRLRLSPAVSFSGAAYAYLGGKLSAKLKVGPLKLKMGAELTGGVNFTLRGDIANGRDVLQDSVYLGGNLRAVAKLLGFKRIWEDFYWQYYPVVGEDDPAYPPAEPPQPRDEFQGRGETGTGGENAQGFHPDAAPTPQGGALVDNAPENADPAVTGFGRGGAVSAGGYEGGVFMSWCEDVAARSEENRSGLVWSAYLDGKWSEPALVHDDKTADYAPRVLAVGDTVYLLWQNAGREFTAPFTAEEYAASMDIYAAVYKNGQITGVTNLSAGCAGYCGLHSLSLDNKGRVVAQWVCNSDGSLFFEEGENRAYQAVFSGGGWQPAVQQAAAAAPGQPVPPLFPGLTARAEGGDDEEALDIAGVSFYRRESGELCCLRGGKEEVLTPGRPVPAFDAAAGGDGVFLYWLSSAGEGNNRLEGLYYAPKTGKKSEPAVYLDEKTALRGVSAAMDKNGIVLLAYQSSVWEDAARAVIASTDLKIAALPLPDPAFLRGAGTLWLVLAAAAGIVLAAGGVLLALLLRRRRASPAAEKE